MKKLLFLAIFSTSILANAKTPTGVTYDTKITRIIDGDTVVVQANYLPKPLKPELAVRIYGVDTPEKGWRAECPAEDAKAKAASEFTQSKVSAAAKQQLILYSWDKYGGRVLGDIILDGNSLRNMLIANGFAREYYGDTKLPWC